MGFTAKTVTSKPAVELKQPEVGKLIRKLRQLTQLNQSQFAAVLGVSFGTINRWENGHMQPSSLALRQIRSLAEALSYSSSETVRDESQRLLTQYFEKR
ncbi:transcriptional regulator [Merismopedia glauca CCAP 1448/3]|uniref:Transcriptional regulator n=2 Tax=Merismopedia TaxID=53402 RepID=A0A2T1C4K3_9CYAN|nr:transcriptional regulator [Merismopedia glauca CCAP 1448/3]